MRAAAAGGATRKHRLSAVKSTRPSQKRASYQSSLENARHAAAAKKLSTGKLDGITLQDLEDVFAMLSQGESGVVHVIVLDEFLGFCVGCNPVELDALHSHIKFIPGDFVTARELYIAIHKGHVKTILRQALKEKDHRKENAGSVWKEARVERSFLVNRVAWRVDRDDAFGTLPTTAVYFMIFVILVVYHLQIWTRQEVERGMEWFVSNYGKSLLGPYYQQNVYSLDTYRDWASSSGVESFFNDVFETTPGSAYVQLSTGTYMVGDVYLQKKTGDDYTKESIWLLSHSLGSSHLAAHANAPAHFSDAAKITLRHHLDQSNLWVNDETKEVLIGITAYNNRAEMYVKTEARIRLDNFGYPRLTVKANSTLVRPYPIVGIIVIDALYILLICYTVWCEGADMCDAIRVGWKSFLDYWNFWNFVDWMTIILGVCNIAFWILSCFAMQASSFHDILTEDNDGMLRLQSNLVGSELSALTERILDDMRRLDRLLFALQFSVASTAIFLVVKFFKSFEANPRLQSVTRTIKCVGTDIAHFFLFCVPIYVAFALCGHVLFGNDLAQFYTIGNSLNTGVIVLMGEFEWYDDLSDDPSSFPSDMPRWALAAWFYMYTWVIMLVLLNMLLAIVLERHSQVVAALSGRRDARTIWSQAWRWLKRKRETRRFIPLGRIRHALENSDDPAHEELAVTKDSLQKAFEGMKPEQASWIMDFLRSELEGVLAERLEDESQATALRTERFVQSISEELHVLSLHANDCVARLTELEHQVAMRRGLSIAQEQRASLMSSVAQIAQEVKSIQFKVGPIGRHEGYKKSTPE